MSIRSNCGPLVQEPPETVSGNSEPFGFNSQIQINSHDLRMCGLETCTVPLRSRQLVILQPLPHESTLWSSSIFLRDLDFPTGTNSAEPIIGQHWPTDERATTFRKL